ncbi:MAG: glycosyltransferase family A protein [Enterococcus casseliflavus]
MGLVSVIVTCYNHEKYIEQCLKSVLSQTYPEIELLVINDGSTDKSEEIILKTLELSNTKYEYIYQENSGVLRNKKTVG